MTNKISDNVHELRRELEKLGKAELYEYAVKQYYLYCDTRDWCDYEAGRFAYLFYKRKGGKRVYKWYEFKFHKPSKRRSRLIRLKVRIRRLLENNRAKKPPKNDLPSDNIR